MRVNDNRNMILAIVLSMFVLIGWTFISGHFLPVAPKPVAAAQQEQQSAAPQSQAGPVADRPTRIRPLAAVLGESPRLPIRTPKLVGSINLKGARIDDIMLPTYAETIAKHSPAVRLYSPSGTADSYFASFGWVGQGLKAPNEDSVWTAQGSALTPTSPVVLTWNNNAGQTFEIRLTVDENYMITAAQKVSNGGPASVGVKPYALISRKGHSKDLSTWTIHTGPIGVYDKAANYDVDFANLDGQEPGFFTKFFGTKAVAGDNRYTIAGGWVGFTDKYWLSALVPDQKTSVTGKFQGRDGQYQADISPTETILPAGRANTQTTRLFTGAKEVNTLQAYEGAGILLFTRAIDWGWFEIIEKPIFYLLDWLFHMVGNFGVAIILLTIIVRGAMFPIAQRQFVSMGKMRTLQPRMKALQEQHKNDKAKLQQEMMAMYQREKINPLGGCLPIFLQIPIFFALYKVLMLSTEMRHQPFVFWIKDLSAPDPLTPVNLFGLLPFTPPHFFAIGVLPILLGITMYVQQKLNPAPMDETQKQVFAIMPWMFMFIMAPFAAGLQLYWVVSNLLTIGQQKWLYSRDPSLKPAK